MRPGRSSNLEEQGLKAIGADLDAVRAGFEIETLEGAIEVVHLAGEVPVHEHGCVVRFDLQRTAPSSENPTG